MYWSSDLAVFASELLRASPQLRGSYLAGHEQRYNKLFQCWSKLRRTLPLTSNGCLGPQEARLLLLGLEVRVVRALRRRRGRLASANLARLAGLRRRGRRGRGRSRRGRGRRGRSLRHRGLSSGVEPEPDLFEPEPEVEVEAEVEAECSVEDEPSSEVGVVAAGVEVGVFCCSGDEPEPDW